MDETYHQRRLIKMELVELYSLLSFKKDSHKGLLFYF